jgi:hypothetical protein
LLWLRETHTDTQRHTGKSATDVPAFVYAAGEEMETDSISPRNITIFVMFSSHIPSLSFMLEQSASPLLLLLVYSQAVAVAANGGLVVDERAG